MNHTTEMAPAAADLSRDAANEARLEAVRPFIERLQTLRDGDRGRLAALKRSAGSTWDEARNVAWFYQLLDGEGRGRDMEIFFLVATLFAHNDKRPPRGNFGQTMAVLKTPGKASPEAVERRFRVLLDADLDRREGGRPAGGELAFRLRQLVKLAAAHDVGVNWAQLLVDLRRWGMTSKAVQRAWAESFYPAPMPRDAGEGDVPPSDSEAAE